MRATTLFGRATPSSAGSATPRLDAVCRAVEWLIVALPALFLIGRTPADVAVTLTALVFLWRSAASSDWAWTRRAWVRIAIAVWLYLVVTNALAPQPELGLGHALAYARFLLFAAALEHWLLADAQRLRRFTRVLAWVVAFVVVDCVVQFVGGYSVTGQAMPETYRLSGPFGGQKPGTFLAKTAFLVVAVVAAWAVGRRWPERLLLGALLAAIAFVILLTGERSALVCFAAGAAVLLLAVREFRVVLIVAAVVAGIGGAAVMAERPTVLERLVEHTRDDFEGFHDKRYGKIARTALSLWETRPILGIGLKHYRVLCADPKLAEIGTVGERCYPHPHHVYLEWLTEAGIVGVMGFLALIGAWTAQLLAGLLDIDRRRVVLAACGAAALVVFLWPLATSMSVFVTWNGILLWQAVGWAMAVSRARA